MPNTAKKQNQTQVINGIDVEALMGSIEGVRQDPKKGLTRWAVTTQWKGGTQVQTKVKGYEIGGKYVKKDFTINCDEPYELGGTNQFANPQETLMTALNSCMAVGYVVLASLQGIEIEELRIETKGEIDLRGFFALDKNVPPGCDHIDYTVYIKGNGTPEQFQKIHEGVMQTSPNYFHLSHPIPLKPRLVVE